MIGTVAVIGLGQIGSSLGAALRKRNLAKQVIGIVRNPARGRQAIRRGAADQCTTRLDALADADLVVLATPVRHILRILPDVVPLLRPGALLTDVGSTKVEIHRTVERLHRRRGSAPFSFLGGHPMSGTETAGIAGCDPDLFRDRPWILIPSSLCAPRHVRVMTHLVRSLGARPLRMNSPDLHDRSIAVVSHVPYLFSYALMASAGDDHLSVAGNSFRDATRVARSSPEMVLDFLLTNRRHLPRAARVLARTLLDLAREVDQGAESRLLRRICDARRRRSRLTAAHNG